MKWKIIEHSDDHICVEFEDGTRLNYNTSSLIDTPKQNVGDPIQESSGLYIGGTVYRFDKNGVLPIHTHDTIDTLHSIECLQGKVIVYREHSGDKILSKGDIASIELGEKHSVKALEPSKTLHLIRSEEHTSELQSH